MLLNMLNFNFFECFKLDLYDIHLTLRIACVNGVKFQSSPLTLTLIGHCMPNVKLFEAIFMYYKIFKFHIATNTHTHSCTNAHIC